MERKINVTSTVLEKSLDMAKGFLNKLIMPAVEEAGLLIKDHVTMWRFNNQVRMVNKAKAYCEKHNIAPKTISLKLLCPLLDYSGLEEDESLQDKWAILLGNMVDSEQNIENHVFPYILSQISKHEYDFAEQAFKSKKNRVGNLAREKEQFIADRPEMEKNHKKQLSEIELKLDQLLKGPRNSQDFYADRTKLLADKQLHQSQLKSLGNRLDHYKYKIAEPEEISYGQLKEFEISNLIRLGLIKEIREAYVESQTLEIPNDPEEDQLTVDLDFEVLTEDSFILTELGELFIEACSEKSNRSTGNSK